MTENIKKDIIYKNRLKNNKVMDKLQMIKILIKNRKESNMKTLFTIVLLFTACVSFSQITATTEDGRKVLLKNDSTWTFINEKIEDSTNVVQSSSWEIDYYVDNFGDKTNKQYQVYFDSEGKFSNSATSGSELFTKVIIDEQNIRFDLYEYGKGPSVGKEIGTATYNLSVKSGSETYSYSLIALEKTLILKNKDRVKFLDMLKIANNELKCYIVIKGEYSSSSTYNFKMEPLK